MKHNGNLIITRENAGKYTAVTEVTGSVALYEGATLNAPVLTKTGYVYLREGATLNAPVLAKTGYVYLRADATLTAPGLTETGSVYLHEGATLNAPVLAKAGYVFLRAGATLNAPKLYPKGFSNFKVYDGIGCVVLSEKTRDGITILSCREPKIENQQLVGARFYIAKSGEHTAHGKTIQEAVEELHFKTAARDVEKYRNMPMTTRKTPKQWAMVYREITGACRYGTQDFMKRKGGLKKSYTLQEILDETKGAYGYEKFAEVVK